MLWQVEQTVVQIPAHPNVHWVCISYATAPETVFCLFLPVSLEMVFFCMERSSRDFGGSQQIQILERRKFVLLWNVRTTRLHRGRRRLLQTLDLMLCKKTHLVQAEIRIFAKSTYWHFSVRKLVPATKTEVKKKKKKCPFDWQNWRCLY